MNQQNVTYSAGGIITNDSKQVVLICENGNFWGLPKGRIETGEDALAAAIREVKEEAGVERLRLVTPLGRYERHPFTLDNKEDKSELKIIEMFLFHSDQVEMQPIETNTEAVWLSIQEAAERLTHPADKSFFLIIKDRIESAKLV